MLVVRRRLLRPLLRCLRRAVARQHRALDGNERGTFQGGYRGIITGDLLNEAAWPTHGRVGVVDYECDIDGNCPGAVNWIGQYFEPGAGFEYAWWGWIYHGGRYGTWVNSSDGNAGDII